MGTAGAGIASARLAAEAIAAAGPAVARCEMFAATAAQPTAEHGRPRVTARLPTQVVVMPQPRIAVADRMAAMVDMPVVVNAVAAVVDAANQ